MNKKKSFGESLEAFFAGKGFYIVLFLCVAVIGVSAWVMLTENGTDVDDTGIDMTLANSPKPTQSAKPAPSATPVVTEEPQVNAENAETDVTEGETETTMVEEDIPVYEESAPTSVQSEPDVVNDFFVWPVTGEVENGYSMAALVYSRTMRDWRTHDGLDIAAELGTQVKAASGGTVEDVYSDDMYGMTVVIDHGNNLKSTYSNLADVPTVAAGDLVTPGQVIGAVGDTALCETGEVTHLHFAMSLNGESVDPTEYMP